MTKKVLLLAYAIAATLIVVVGFAFFWQSLVEGEEVHTIALDGTIIRAIVVDSPEERAKGLSGRENLA